MSETAIHSPSDKSPTIGVIVSGSRQSDIFPLICAGIERAAAAAGFSTSVRDVSSVNPLQRVERSLAAARELIAAKVAGVIFQPVQFASDGLEVSREIIRLFTDAGVAVVLIDSDVLDLDGSRLCDCVSIDNFAAGAALGLYLQRKGAEHVRFLTEWHRCSSIEGRLAGFRSTQQEIYNALWYGDAASDEDVGAMLEDDPMIDAVICQNDVAAVKLIATLTRFGKRVPQDIRVVGFDAVSDEPNPPFTTIHQPCLTLAQVAVDAVLHRLRNPDRVTATIQIQADIRESLD